MALERRAAQADQWQAGTRLDSLMVQNNKKILDRYGPPRAGSAG